MSDLTNPDSRWQNSKRMLEEARRYLAGGVSSNVRLSREPWPLFFKQGSGSRLVDVDENVYIDYLLGQGPLLLGHRPPEVVEAVKQVLEQGQLFGGQHELEITLAKRLCELIPCAESVRFGSSGSEMVQSALRLARGHTGRNGILKFEGHYHGWFDNVLASVHPPLDQAGDRTRPRPVPETKGHNPAVLVDTLILPWNDFGLLHETFRHAGDRLAAVIMEPVMFNTHAILPRPGYLEAARRLCDEYGVVLIFDEVITGFRLGLGGAQQQFGVVPDLAVFGKAMASGFPIACLAGKKQLMDLIASGDVVHAGTYNSNLMVMAAAEATTRTLMEQGNQIYDRLSHLGRRLMDGIREAARRVAVPLIVEGLPAAFAVAYSQESTIQDYREHIEHCDLAKYRRLVMALLAGGVHVAGRGIWYLSAAHTATDIEKTLEVFELALQTIENEPASAGQTG